ncbi:hypothetical protein SUSAZ_08830 [Sulfolobus acidocaldarius SUSAZ]|nr:hypothetical protein SUSAZ_08830 [Sulfolobus acidocaldarius SUSAZ]
MYKDKGVSLVIFTEIVRTSPGEGARVKVRDGKVYFYLGLGPHGQAYSTTFKKLASETLGIGEESIEVITGNTDTVKEGIESFGSRAGAIGGSAVIAAGKELLKKFNISSLKSMDLSKFEGTEVEVFYRADDIFAPGAHVVVVDVDKETGFVKVIDYCAVDDVG